jgi:hypothetical protein
MARGPRFFYFKYQQRFLRPPFYLFSSRISPTPVLVVSWGSWPGHNAIEHRSIPKVEYIYIYQGSKEDNLVHIILMRSVEKERKKKAQIKWIEVDFFICPTIVSNFLFYSLATSPLHCCQDNDFFVTLRLFYCRSFPLLPVITTH